MMYGIDRLSNYHLLYAGTIVSLQRIRIPNSENPYPLFLPSLLNETNHEKLCNFSCHNKNNADLHPSCGKVNLNLRQEK